jgi:hypothetical protein
MSAFRKHFLDKYFGYRSRYVAAVAELAPHRRSLAVASEIARLCFSIFACGLVVFITSIAFVRAIGHAPWFWVLSFGLIVAMPLFFGCLAIVGVRDALRDRAR